MSSENVVQSRAFYDALRQWFAIIPPIVCPINFLIDAPFGRFAPKGDSVFLVDGVKAWMAMELVSPLTFTYAYTHSPLSLTHPSSAPPLTLRHPPSFLAALFLIHYLNRAIISPLRTPSRSKSHVLVPLLAVGFNCVNPWLMGVYLSSPEAEKWLEGAFGDWKFWIGVAVWGLGFLGNIVHDEVLLNIRRNAKAKGKAKAIAEEEDEDDNGKKKKNVKEEHYAIPYGYLYTYISYPNYFCEWLEWLGFALAASPLPSLSSLNSFLATVNPPWLFFLSEIFLMIPRAWKGHKWYHARFPDYPKERKAVIPFLF